LSGHLIEEVGCIQAIDTSPWLVFEKGLRINKVITKNEGGELEIQPKFSKSAVNIEDVRHHLELYNNLVCSIHTYTHTHSVCVFKKFV
jgi:hypothetical protein